MPYSHLRGFLAARKFLASVNTLDISHSNTTGFLCGSHNGKVGIPTGLEFLPARKNSHSVNRAWGWKPPVFPWFPWLEVQIFSLISGNPAEGFTSEKRSPVLSPFAKTQPAQYDFELCRWQCTQQIQLSGRLPPPRKSDLPDWWQFWHSSHRKQIICMQKPQAGQTRLSPDQFVEVRAKINGGPHGNVFPSVLAKAKPYE